jgi:hypothetical protein
MTRNNIRQDLGIEPINTKHHQTRVAGGIFASYHLCCGTSSRPGGHPLGHCGQQ